MQSGKKILMIIAFWDFKDEEYFVPKEIFEKAGFEVKTASAQEGTASGSEGGEVEVDLILNEVAIDDFDAAVFVGGPGAHKHLDDPTFHKIAQEAVAPQKLLAAICIAPAILAKAGVLKDKKATVWASVLDKSAVKILKENGAKYQPDSMVQDGNIITANGPAAAAEFGQKIAQWLTRSKK
jgi:protease I